MKIKLTFFMILLCAFSFAQHEFITIWKPNNPSNTYYNSTDKQILFPGIGNNYNIYWEEVGNASHHGNLTNVNSSIYNPLLIDFGVGASSDAQYILKVSDGNGSFSSIDSRRGDYEKILEIRQWGNIKWTTMKYAFDLGFNLDVTATDIPDLSAVTDASYMFSGCKKLVGNSSFELWDISHLTDISRMFYICEKFNQNIENWDTSNVTNMEGIFASAKIFNQPIGNWDVSNVTNMTAVFNEAANFNQNIGNWNTSNVQKMFLMFGSAILFNQNIGNWNTSNVTDMWAMFNQTEKFNQNIGNWDTSNVTNMQGMFEGADSFNQNIGNWNTSNITNMSAMFNFAISFNQNIGDWDTSNVTDMTNMFTAATNFNQNIGNWNISKVKSTAQMFLYAYSFNQDIGNWNTSSVNNMMGMFIGATSFNQNIGNWDTSHVTDMRDMFRNASNFNQSLEKWNLKNLTQVNDMFQGSKLSCLNYDKTLIGWANNSDTPNNLQFTDNTNITYSSSQAVNARNYLINTKGWTISGDTYNPNCALSTNELQTKKIQVYPNPAKDFISIENLKENSNLEIYDIQGKLIKREKYQNSQIALKNLSKGIYIIKIPSENYSLKLIVE